MSLFTYYCGCEQLYVLIILFLAYPLLLLAGFCLCACMKKKKYVEVTRERLKDISKFSEEHPSPKNDLYPTNIFKLNDKEEYLEIK